MKFRRQLKTTVGNALNRSNTSGVFNTRYTISELEDELSRRDNAIKNVEKKADKYHQKKRQFLEKAAESKNQRKLRYVAKAKEAEMYKSFHSELFDNLMAQQLFLTKLVLKAKEKQIFDAPMEEFGFQVDIAGMNADAVTDALQRSDLSQDEIADTMDEIEMEFDTMSGPGISLDLDDLKEEAEMLEAEDIESQGVDLGSELDSAIDDQIEQELDRLEEGSTLNEEE